LIGWPELMLIIIVALFLFGPKKLPELARTVGQAVREYRRVIEAPLSTPPPVPVTREERIRELANSLGIEVPGKEDEKVVAEIKEALKGYEDKTKDT